MILFWGEVFRVASRICTYLTRRARTEQEYDLIYRHATDEPIIVLPPTFPLSISLLSLPANITPPFEVR